MQFNFFSFSAQLKMRHCRTNYKLIPFLQRKYKEKKRKEKKEGKKKEKKKQHSQNKLMKNF